MPKLSLCNICKQGALECEFMNDLTPVEGWKADKVQTKDGMETYNVIECPKYVQMRNDPTREYIKTCCVCGKVFTKDFKAQVRCRACIDAGLQPKYKPLYKGRRRKCR